MAKRYIGIDLDGETARVALLMEDGGKTSLVLRKKNYETPENAREVLNELIEGTRALGDHLVTALPAGVGLFRRLSFPFKEKSKLVAVLPSELDSKVPISLVNHVCAMLPPREKEGSYLVDAAAVDSQAIEALLENFSEPAQHPRRIDLMPYALVGGLNAEDGLVAYCAYQETVVALVLDGCVVESRLLPNVDGVDEEEIARFVISNLQQLERTAGLPDLPFWACGSAVTEELLNYWRDAGRISVAPELSLEEQDIPAEYLPAVLLALSEKRSARLSGFNFRIGSYAPQGQMEMMKKKLAAAAVLLLLCVMVLGGSSYFDYHNKARKANLLNQQLEEVFRQTIPEASSVFDVPLQMQSHLKQLREQALLLGVGGQVNALNALQALSSLIDEDLTNDLKELSYNGDQIKIDGYTGSFDSVNQITQALGKSPIFSKVEISDAKMAADGSRVDFQLQIDLSKSGGAL
ncbi:MAG TPA: type II secretion system protein GspL [Geopsychrobacteraceae bacterium]|nr:type II secretion system protein GspL [Geopsychrobacteraceae bacterium]